MLTRPERGDCADYYFTYIDKAPDGDVLEQLAAQPDELRKTLAGVTDEQARIPYAEGKWSINQLVTHLIDGDRVFAYRALSIGRQDPAELPDFDQDIWVASCGADERALPDLLEEFDLARRSIVAQFRGFPKDAWDQSGIASSRPISVRSMPWLMVGHMIHHDQVLRERYPQVAK